GNNDGTADRLQAQIVSLPDAVNGDYLTLEIDTPDCIPGNVRVETEESLPEQDSGYLFPQGLLGFEPGCAEADVRVHYHGISALSDNAYRAYEAPAAEDAVVWYGLPEAGIEAMSRDERIVVTARFTLKEEKTDGSGKIVHAGGLALNAGIVSLSAPAAVLENEGPVFVTVTRSGSAGAVSVGYAAAEDGANLETSAVANVDFTPADGVFSWTDGDKTEQTFVVEILDNDVADGNKTLMLSIDDDIAGEGADPGTVTVFL
ncbi:MAG: hypothetical protein GY862_01690, partial [Gammaproteobacteria bacterium]|nr:hypothetical protein [Gammaproteobacteria bacterium]